MAASEGYKCEFTDSVFEDLYCKKCNLVARRLTVADCCGESFCQTCIADTREQGQPCPVCGENEFATFKSVKNQKRIDNLRAYCSMNERGCVWSGTLNQLDTHLDPHLDNCQYVDTKCPRNCLQTIPKNKVDHHVAQECTKRPHVCQHCGFKATYEEVVDTHLPECKYVPLQCPNMCGVSCDREVMDDHMKICRLEEVECEFTSVGCDGRFIREDQDKHARQNNQKHLTLTAYLALETKEQLQQKLLEQDKKHEEEEEKLKKKVEEQEKKLGGQEKKLEEQEKKLEEQEKKLGEQEKKLCEKDKEISELKQSQKPIEATLQQVVAALKENTQDISNLNHFTHFRRFEMKDFMREKAKDRPYNNWMSPDMYTHTYGYKFNVAVAPNGTGTGRGNSVTLRVAIVPGEFDEQLNWPKKVKFTITLESTTKKRNPVSIDITNTWDNPNRYAITRYRCHFIKHSELEDYLVNDTLSFIVSKIELLDT